MKQIKEFFTSYYNSEDDKIVGATKNSLIYFHEEGHRKQFKTGKYQLLVNYFNILILLTLVMLVRENFSAQFICYINNYIFRNRCLDLCNKNL